MNAEAHEFARDLFAVFNRLRRESLPVPRIDDPRPRPHRPAKPQRTFPTPTRPTRKATR